MLAPLRLTGTSACSAAAAAGALVRRSSTPAGGGGCTELLAAGPAPGWCTGYNCTADAAQPVMEGQLFRFFPLPNRSHNGGLMAWEEHNVAPFSGDVVFSCVDSAYASWLRGGNTLISVGDFRWSTAFGQYAWCEDAEPGSCRYSGGGARVGNVNPFGPWTHKGAASAVDPEHRHRTKFPSHSCNLTASQSTCPGCSPGAAGRNGQSSWYNLTLAQKLELTQQCDTNIKTGAWFSLESAGKCKRGQHVDAARPPSERPGGGCAWEWLPAAGVKTIEVACLNATGYFSACADAQLVSGYGCAYTRAAALFRKAVASCPNVTAKLNLRYKTDDEAPPGHRTPGAPHALQYDGGRSRLKTDGPGRSSADLRRCGQSRRCGRCIGGGPFDGLWLDAQRMVCGFALRRGNGATLNEI
jgi:hypothetical protein